MERRKGREIERKIISCLCILHICLSSMHPAIILIYPSSIYISIPLSSHLSIHSSIHPSSIYPSTIQLCIRPFIISNHHLSIHPPYLSSLYPYIHPQPSIISIYPSIHPVVCPFIYPSYLSIYHLSIDLSSLCPSHPSICLSVSVSGNMKRSGWGEKDLKGTHTDLIPTTENNPAPVVMVMGLRNPELVTHLLSMSPGTCLVLVPLRTIHH